MVNLVEIIKKMRANPANVRFADLCKVCDNFFGQARQTSGSHRVYKTPWIGDPRVNIKGQSKAYQVKQVLKAIERLEVEDGTEK